jgi:hypothetical protein
MYAILRSEKPEEGFKMQILLDVTYIDVDVANHSFWIEWTNF